VQVERPVPLVRARRRYQSGRIVSRRLWIPVWDALAAGLLLALAHDGARVPQTAAEVGSSLTCALAAPIALAAAGQYDADVVAPGRRLRTASNLALVASLTLVAGLTLPGEPSVTSARRIALAVVCLAFFWLIARWITSPATRNQRTLVVGSGVAARRVAELARTNGENGIEVVGLLDDDALPQPDGSPPLLGGLDDVEMVLRDHSIDRVIVAFTRRGDAGLVDLVRLCDSHRVAIDVVPRLFDVIRPSGSLLGGLVLTDATPSRPGRHTLATKRAFDLLGSLAMLIVCAPIMLLIAAHLRLISRGPVFYRQQRIGRAGQSFDLLKFRTMRAVATPSSSALSDGRAIGTLVAEIKDTSQDLVPLGGWLRRTSLDELPQAFCILMGHMSLVGPRPLRPFEVAALEDWELERLQVRPGLTGLWQVLGRSDARWDERMRLDYMYARHWSLGWDIRILTRTVPAVLRQRGAR
jgi:exopolysaccharide biosynthesis polyprenyl glycosylphosphotransferase